MGRHATPAPSSPGRPAGRWAAWRDRALLAAVVAISTVAVTTWAGASRTVTVLVAVGAVLVVLAAASLAATVPAAPRSPGRPPRPGAPDATDHGPAPRDKT